MIRYKPTAIVLGPEDLLFHLERFRYTYARIVPCHPVSSDEDDDEDEGHDDAFLGPDSFSPYYFSPASSKFNSDSEPDYDFSSSQQRGGLGEERDNQPSLESRLSGGISQMEEPIDFQLKKAHEHNSLEIIHSTLQEKIQAPGCRKQDRFSLQIAQNNTNVSLRQLIPDTSLSMDLWKTTLNTAYKGLENSLTKPDYPCAQHPLTSSCQWRPPVSDFSLPSVFSARKILLRDSWHQTHQRQLGITPKASLLENTKLNNATLDPEFPLGDSTRLRLFFTRPTYSPSSNLPRKETTRQLHAMATSGWTPVNMQASSAPRTSRPTTGKRSNIFDLLTIDSPPKTDSHSQEHRDKLVSSLSPSSETDVLSNTSTYTHNTPLNTQVGSENAISTQGRQKESGCTIGNAPYGTHLESKKVPGCSFGPGRKCSESDYPIGR
ncbi:hypothetical protein BJX96DRAFT_169099 [Aspergillus floccosus]